MADLVLLPSNFLLYLTIFLISAFLLYLLLRKQNPEQLKLPPGTTGWPIIGENLHFVAANRKGSPEKFISDRTSKHGSENVFRTSLAGETLAVLCGALGNKFLFSNEERYVRAWWPRSVDKLSELGTGKSLAPTKALRACLVEFVKPEALRSYAPVMDAMAKEHLEKEWGPRKEVRVFDMVKKFTFRLAFRLFMNIQDQDLVEKIGRTFEDFGNGLISIPINLPGTDFYGAVKARRVMFEELMGVIRKREEEITMEKKDKEDEEDSSSVIGQDMLTRMLQTLLLEDDDSKIETTMIESSLTGLLVASHDTTSSAITSTVCYLAEFPHIYDQVLKEQMEILRAKGPNELLDWEDIKKMKYSWMVACEAMRLTPPAAGSFREVVADFTFAGFTIPKGWKTFWTVHSTHKNPKYFPDPEKFDPSRFEGTGPPPFTFVPFGGGPRMCPGKEYARLQILVFMHNLVTKFKWRKAIPDEKFIYTISAVPAKGLPVWIEPHNWM